MQFKELKVGGTLYVYDRQNIALTANTISAVSLPHMDKVNNVPMMMVDVSIEGNTYTFRDASEIGYIGNLIISADRELILKDVEAQKANNESVLARVDTIKSELPKLEAVIDTLNPSAKEKKQNEERLSRLEDSIGSLKNMVELVLKQKANGKRTED